MKKLHEIIDQYEKDNLTIFSYEEIAPYKNSLKIWFNEYHMSKPIFVATFVTNAIQAGYLTTFADYSENMGEYLNTQLFENAEELENEKELLSYQSHEL